MLEFSLPRKKMKSILEDLYIKYYIVFSYFCSLPFFFEVQVYIYHIFYDYFKLFELGLEPSFKNFYWNHLYIIYTIKYFQTNTFLYTQYICRRVKIAQFSRLYSQRHLLDNFSLFLKGYK